MNVPWILEHLGPKVTAHGGSHEDFWIQVQGKHLTGVVEFLRNDPDCRFDFFVDLCGVDYLGREPRFESVVHLRSTGHNHRIRIRCMVPDDTLTVPSLTPFWQGANWYEREAFDMYGIRYDGHPDLARILSAPGVSEHPQRKDFPLRGNREET